MEYRAESKMLGVRTELDASRPRSTSLAQAFDPRHNSLNFLRLVFALGVIFGHAQILGGYGGFGLIGNRTAVGTLAVYGFFAISGFLIAASASQNRLGRYLWQRSLRIFPAFWVCLIVTVVLLGWIGWVAENHLCGLSCYVGASDGPLPYLLHNGLLRITQNQVSGTPTHIPSPFHVWHGSLWTLFYEFVCYLVLGALAAVGLLRRRRVVLALTIAAWLLEIIVVASPDLNNAVSLNHLDLQRFLTLVPIFLAGSLLYLYREELPDSGLLASMFLGAFVVSFWLPIGSSEPVFHMTSAGMLAPLLAYPALWLGIHLPFQRIGARNDYSYGTYIYAYPVQQTLSLWGVYRLGYLPYLLLGVAGTVPFAVASWWLVEKRALALKKIELRQLKVLRSRRA